MKPALKSNVARFFVLLCFVLGCWMLGRFLQLDLGFLQQKFQGVPPILSGFLFVILYVTATTFIWFGPKDVLRVLAAIMFGGFLSTVFVFIGEIFNAVIFFTLSRKLGRDYVRQKFHFKDADVDKMSEKKGVIGWLAMRCNPIISFRLLDLGAGLSRVSLKKYFIVCLFASPIRVFWLQYIVATIGSQALRDPQKLVSALSGNPFLLKMSSIYFLFVILISIAAVIEKFCCRKKKVA